MSAVRIAVCGGSSSPDPVLQLAFQVGAEIARAGAILFTGGGGGVMAAASRGAKSEGGMTVGVFPGTGRDPGRGIPPQDVDLPIYTGIGQARNLVLVLSSEAVIAVDGEWGTLSEIALAAKHGRPVIGLDSWRLDPPGGPLAGQPVEASDAADAVAKAIAAASRNRA